MTCYFDIAFIIKFGTVCCLHPNLEFTCLDSRHALMHEPIPYNYILLLALLGTIHINLL